MRSPVEEDVRADVERASPPAETAILQVQEIFKRFTTSKRDGEQVEAVKNISFSVGRGEFFTLLGPSGCGKTTTLRMVAGLEVPNAGTIVLNGTTVFSAKEHVLVPANRRGIGMVFQSYAVWPHMSVKENVAYPLVVTPRRRRLPKATIQARVEAVLETVGLSAQRDRRATALSGGQQQRLALARALVMEPSLLLLDEPLSNLDARLRKNMRLELKRLQLELGVTALYVTHDQTEALAMSTRIAVLNEGSMLQVGTPREIYDHPASRFVAGFIGESNFVNGRVRTKAGAGCYIVGTGYGLLEVSGPAALADGQEVLVLIRPEHISLDEGGGDSAWRGTVRNASFTGEFEEYLVGLGSLELRARGRGSRAHRAGSSVTLRFTQRPQVINE